MKNRGVLTADGYWVKADQTGLEHGYKLERELQQVGANTIPAILQFAVEKYGSTPCMGTRKLLERSRIKEGCKTLEKLRFGEYEWLSYAQVYDLSLKVAVSLTNMGLKSGDRISILAETRAEWFIAAVGCLKINLSVVTLYTNLSDSAIVYGINETEVDTVFTSFDLFPRLLKLTSQCPALKQIIVFEDQLEHVGQGVSSFPKEISIIPFQSLLSCDNTDKLNEFPSPSSEDIAIIMYTSGSTGTPKGVELMHKNVFSAILGYSFQADIRTGDKYIAYLPLAHVMELATETALIALGATITYSSPHTLTNNSPKIMKGSTGDCQVARPTSMNAVPVILDRILKAVSLKVDKQGKFKAKLFHAAVRHKRSGCSPFANKVLDAVIFKKVQSELGGRLKMLVVGGAPLSPYTQEVIRAMFGCTIQVGYGSTETTACTTSMDASDIRSGHTGAPNHGVFIRLEDWEEGGYRVTDKPKPRGEIIVGGSSVAKGYFKLPEETSLAFFEENGIRWFRTGDIGEIDESGVLKIIDRKKDLVKLIHGEYISLGTVEAKLKNSPFVENVCVFADSLKERSVCVVIPSASGLQKVATSIGIDSISNSVDLCKDSRIIKGFLEELETHGKKQGLSKWELPACIYLTTDPWTPDNGLVTAALKLRRKPLEKQYENCIRKMYTSVSA